MTTDLETQVHNYAAFLDSTLPAFLADEVIEGLVEPQALSVFDPSESRPRRGRILGLAAALAVVAIAVGAGIISGVLFDSRARLAAGGSPLVVTARYYEAYNARDAAALTELFADEVVLSFVGISSEPLVGKEAVVASQLEEIANPDQPAITLSDPVVEGDTVRGAHSFSVPGHVLTGTIEIVVEDGTISRMTITLDDESIEELQRG